MLKSTYSRILTLLLLMICLILGGLFVLRYYNQLSLKHYTRILGEEKKRLLSRVVQNFGSKLELFAYDYTYWDEMVDYTENRSGIWAAENLDASLKTFGAHALWVYSADLEEIRRTFGFPRTTGKASFVLPREMLEKMRQGNWFLHAFLPTEAGLVELRTAPIQPGADNDRTSAPRGYFIVGMLWTEDLLREIGEMTESTVELSVMNGGKPPEPKPYFTTTHIEAEIRLRGWDGAETAALRLKADSELTERLIRNDGIHLASMLIVSLLVLGVIALFLHRTLNLPLRLIAESLQKNEPSPIRSLLGLTSEFHLIARLMLTFYEQREVLKDEVTRRAEAEKTLRAALEEKESLLREVHHRVKNNLQLILSLLALQQDKTDNESARGLLAEAMDRIRSVALVHENILSLETVSRVYLDDYLSQLCRYLQGKYESDESVKLTFEVPPVPVGVDTAVSLGLILDELIRNAFQHAFPPGTAGEIALRVSDAAGGLEIILSDNGRGFLRTEDYSNPATLGLSIVKALVSQLRAEFEIVSVPGGGIRISMRIPESAGID